MLAGDQSHLRPAEMLHLQEDLVPVDCKSPKGYAPSNAQQLLGHTAACSSAAGRVSTICHEGMGSFREARGWMLKYA